MRNVVRKVKKKSVRIGLGAAIAIAIDAVAELLPATRAAGMQPTEALRRA
ncbi:hypothetical protein [Nonomuraea typhae]|nr:hypothetical protein [Nonomuraea typhae]